MPRLERVWDERNRTPGLWVSGAITLGVALVDWWTRPAQYRWASTLFPIILAARVPSPLGGGNAQDHCAVLAEVFSSLDRSLIRLSFETLALAGCGLFVAELVRNRRISQEAQERLRALIETSPAAIVRPWMSMA